MSCLTVLMPIYKMAHPYTQNSLQDLRRITELEGPIDSVRFVFEQGISCVTQARNAVATRALLGSSVDPEGFVLWADSDMVFNAETVNEQTQALIALYERHAIHALTARCVQRHIDALAAVYDDERDPIRDEELGLVLPIYSGLAATLIRGEEFVRQAYASPIEPDPNDPTKPGKFIVCCPTVEERKGAPYFFSEDFDYSRKIQGGMWLAPEPVPPFGHITEKVVYPNLDMQSVERQLEEGSLPWMKK